MRPSALCVTLSVALAAACGGNVVVDGSTDAGADAAPAPPLPATCAAAMDAIDWTACAGVPGPDIRSLSGVVCAHYVATPGCAGVAETYYAYLASQSPVCLAYDAGVGVGTQISSPPCDGALGMLTDCFQTCAGGYACAEPSWASCTCTGPTANAGKGCSAYPSGSASVPDCNALCKQCSGP